MPIGRLEHYVDRKAGAGNDLIHAKLQGHLVLEEPIATHNIHTCYTAFSRFSNGYMAPPRITIHRFNLVSLAASSIIYQIKPSPVFFVDGIHKTKPSVTAMSFSWYTPHWQGRLRITGKEKGKGKGENYEERHKAQLKNPSFPDSDEVGQIHESIFNVYTKSMKNAKKDNMKRSLRYIQIYLSCIYCKD
ncbi:hypothetical protein K435DRAFT_803422 [Dendrothele bispora CBS 962.96]|uniref:Uncharacterized protein n=1 Tax=Dendrothele bispora (strain CBS 962.96) TaxID=1314807 RepID=A0A4S8LHL5_DENBC|nr:hypothetical protein K435DRAFT_803422 [Dendrothele bispora CBS 962.96]